MKINANFKSIAIFAIVLSAMLTLISFQAFAVESEPSAKINAVNLEYKDKTHVIVNLKENGLTENQQTGIAVWYDESLDANTLTAENANYISFDKKRDAKGIEYFSAHGVASDEYGDMFYIAPLIKTGSEIVVADTPYLYNVVMYLSERLAEDDITDNQAALYEKMLVHGIVADKVLGDGYSFGVVHAKNGTVGYKKATIGAGNIGDTITLKANSYDGKVFLHWLCPDGSTIENAEIQITLTECGEFTYTAVYGTVE